LIIEPFLPGRALYTVRERDHQIPIRPTANVPDQDEPEPGPLRYRASERLDEDVLTLLDIESPYV
jgi:hypothetical protein